MSQRHNILFLCTGNSARSLLAEAAANHPTIGLGKLQAYSAGSRPTGTPHPQALATLERHGIATTGLSSKSWDVYTTPDSPRFDFIITVCSNAADEPCPVWPGHPATGHWGVPDPAAVQDPEEQARAFEDAFQTLKRRIELFASLNLDAMADHEIRAHAAHIVNQTPYPETRS